MLTPLKDHGLAAPRKRNDDDADGDLCVWFSEEEVVRSSQAEVSLKSDVKRMSILCVGFPGNFDESQC
jgi:hypothetical protein